MAEPTSVTTALAAGVGASMLSALSLEPGPLFWGLVGASLGMTAAAAATKQRAAVVFVCVVLASSLLGALVAKHGIKTDTPEAALLARNACSCVLAMLFHPILNGLAASVPEAIRRLLRRLGPDAPGGQP